jgi:hypothetical protein
VIHNARNEVRNEGRVSSDEWREAKKNMKRKVTFLALCAMLLALSYSASAQQPKRVFRIGYLSGFDPAREASRSEIIRQALRERGYIEGQNTRVCLAGE